MRSNLLALWLCLGWAAAAGAETFLYNNTAMDTFDTVLYSTGPYTALGDQIHLAAPGIATQAKVQIYNNGDAGTFDAELDFFSTESAGGKPLGTYRLPDVASAGSDVIDLTFDLGAGLVVPQDLIFIVSVGKMSPGLDPGLNLFEPPTTGMSDNTFLIAAVAGAGFTQLESSGENVYFQLTGTTETPEPCSMALLAAGLLGLVRRVKAVARVRGTISRFRP